MKCIFAKQMKSMNYKCSVNTVIGLVFEKVVIMNKLNTLKNVSVV